MCDKYAECEATYQTGMLKELKDVRIGDLYGVRRQ